MINQKSGYRNLVDPRYSFLDVCRKSLRASSIENRGFTLIELIMTIVVLAIVMIPLGFMSMEYMRSIVLSRHLTVAEGLAKTEMAKINNLAYSDATLEDGDDDISSNYEGYSYDLRRTVNYLAGSSNNLKKVQVKVYLHGETSDHLTTLVTYIANVSYGSGSAGGDVGTGNSGDYLEISGGSISGWNLQNVTLTNIGSSPITITGVTISFTGDSGISFKKITLGGTARWSGTAGSGDTVTLSKNFTLTANTSYANPTFLEFNKNLTSVTSLVFIMSDGSQTIDYAW